MSETVQNWSGNYTFGAARWHRPETIEQVREVVAGCRKVRVIGSRHSFNGIADSAEDIVSLERCQPFMALDRERQTVTVNGGARYGELGRWLQGEGWALHNLASLPHISVAGACATATHGSGDGNGNLATAVLGMELVTAEGEVVGLAREDAGDAFEGAVVGLGGLGVVTKLTLAVQPAFDMRQDVYENLPMGQLEAHFDEITASGYSVSLFTDWQRARVNQVWVKRRVTGGEAFDRGAEFFGATRAASDRHPIDGISAESCTEQMGAPGAWHERLPHFRLEFQPSSGEELQSEYFVPREQAVAAIRAIEGLREQVAPLLLISEVRTIAADGLWMSPCFERASVALHFTWKKDWPAVRRLLPVIEGALAPFEARPHWGKLFTMAPERLRALYPRLEDFKALLGRYDPQGKFRNAFLDRYIFAEG